MTKPAASGPLAGVRILDLTAVVLGPLATQILGDYGADIIKVEPLAGDLMRANGISRHAGMSSVFLSLNRNKRSLAIDLKSARGTAVLNKLIKNTDVLVHNMRVPAMERLGLGYQAVAAIKPDIVYCVATGYGQDGPDADKPAFDDIIQAACGLVSLNSLGRDVPDYVPSLIADKTTGMVLVNAVLAALFCRERTGQGQYVEVPMLETMVAFVMAEHLGGQTFEPAQGPAGYQRLLGGGRKPAPTRDGHIALLPYTADHWRAFFSAAGRADLADKYGNCDREARNAQVADMYRDMAAATPARSSAEWLSLCAELDIPATEVYGIDELTAHPHLRAVQLFDVAHHASEGAVRQVRPPVKFSATPASIRSDAPRLGEHTEDVLREAGLDSDEITELRALHVIA
jgi:formyl-CoA transferase